MSFLHYFIHLKIINTFLIPNDQVFFQVIKLFATEEKHEALNNVIHGLICFLVKNE